MIYIYCLLNLYATLTKRGEANIRYHGLIFLGLKRKVDCSLDLLLMCTNQCFPSIDGLSVLKSQLRSYTCGTNIIRIIDVKLVEWNTSS